MTRLPTTLSRRERARPVAAPSRAARAMEVPELARFVERLVRRGYLPDAIERFVVGWMREAGAVDVGAVARSVRRPLGGVIHARLEGLARDRADRRARPGAAALEADAPASEEPAVGLMTDYDRRPARVRDESYFEGLRAEATEARWAIPAFAWLGGAASVASDAPRAPGVHPQRDASGPVARAVPTPAEILARLGRGRPLPEAVKATLTGRLGDLGLGLDLGPVLVHDGPEADRLCRELGANAFALGRHVAFRAGRYAPDAPDGLALLAHELTHVWQQARGAVPAGGESPALEAEAREVGARVGALSAPNHVAHGDLAVHAPIERAPEGAVPQRCGAPGAHAAPRADGRPGKRDLGGGRVPRAHDRAALVSEARALLGKAGVRPAAIFVVTDRVDAYDASFRARGSWQIRGAVPLAPGYWLDGGVGVDGWSTLTADKVAAIGGGRWDDLWIVSARAAAAGPRPGASPSPIGERAAGPSGKADAGPTAEPPADASRAATSPSTGPSAEETTSAAARPSGATPPAAEAGSPSSGVPSVRPEKPPTATPAVASGPSGGDVPPALAEVLATPGKPIAPALARRFEAATGVDVSHALVHTSDAGGLAEAHGGALAYGHHIVFAAPNPTARLVFHELAHVAQQTGADGARAPVGADGPRGAGPEAEADAVATAILQHGRAKVTLGLPKALIGDEPAATPAPVTLSADDWKKANTENAERIKVVAYHALEFAVGARLVHARGAAQNGVTGDSEKGQAWSDALGPTSLAIAQKQCALKLPVTGIADDATLTALGFMKASGRWTHPRAKEEWAAIDQADDQKLAGDKASAAKAGAAGQDDGARRAAIIAFARTMIGTVDASDRGDGKKYGGGRIVDIYATVGKKPDADKEGDLRASDRFGGDTHKKKMLAQKAALEAKVAAGTAEDKDRTALASIAKIDLTQKHLGDWSWCGLFAVYCVKVATGIGGWTSGGPTGFKAALDVAGDPAKLAAANAEPGDILAVNSTNQHHVLLAEKPAGDGSGSLRVVEGNVEAQGIRESTRLTAANIVKVYKPF